MYSDSYLERNIFESRVFLLSGLIFLNDIFLFIKPFLHFSFKFKMEYSAAEFKK